MIFLSNGNSCVEHVRQCLDNIDQHASHNAFVEVYAEEALDRARDLDQRRAQGMEIGSLYGAVVSIKDVIAHEGHTLTACSKMLGGFTSQYSATVTSRLVANDAIIIGRTSCDEFAMGSDNRTSCYGPVTNPHDASRVPGGSSGGAAVSAAIGGCDVAVGSDTGGSVRQPASFCGMIGMKPTYGTVSRHGLISYGSSFDQIGFIGKDLDKIQAVFDAVKGQDAYDSTLADLKTHNQQPKPAGPLKVAILSNSLDHPSLDREIRTSIHNLTETCQKSDIEVLSYDFDLLDYVVPTYYVLASAEASSNLSRYDGVRFGYRHPNATGLDDMYEKSRAFGFGDEVKRRILLGTFVLSYGYYDQYFGQAQRVRRLIRDRLTSILTDVDLILLPMTSTVAWKLESEMSPVEMYMSDIYSVLANLAGIPALSLPLGTNSEGLPYGLQVLGDSFKEKELIFNGQRIISCINER